MQFNFSHSCVPLQNAQKISRRLFSYIQSLQSLLKKNEYSFPECSLLLPNDIPILKSTEKCAALFKGALVKYIVLIGIGGSNLGAKAVYDALYGNYDFFTEKRRPKMIFLDTVDPLFLAHTVRFLKKKIQKSSDVAFIIVSKSGETSETVMNSEIVLIALQKSFHFISDRLAVITDRQSILWQHAQRLNLHILEIPKHVGGRYSVFSNVGLFPLKLLGIDVNAFRKGAQDMARRCLRISSVPNPALYSASVLFYAIKHGFRIHDLFTFHPRLESLGKWYRQLLGESIGKECDSTGIVVHAGIMPTVTLGTTDLHSVGQLYLGGPRQVMTTFLWNAVLEEGTRVSSKRMFNGLVPALDGKTPHDLLAAVYGGTKAAYQKKQLPFIEAKLSGISEYEIGAFFQWKMLEVMYLGKLLGVNAFDQPEVELYKKEARKLL